jgi:hypothetical protein
MTLENSTVTVKFRLLVHEKYAHGFLCGTIVAPEAPLCYVVLCSKFKNSALQIIVTVPDNAVS